MSSELTVRDKILELEEVVAELDQLDWDTLTTHHFAPGVYSRELFIPKGTVLIGKMHRHACTNVLLKGKIKVITEFEEGKILEAPLIWTSPPNTKRAGYAIEDTIWVNIHPNEDNEQDLVKLEDKFIIPENALESNKRDTICHGQQ
jgi:hypothetical protein